MRSKPSLMGCLAGVMEAQYNCLRANGHTPSEAFNETVEELTQSLMPLVAENGMDWMYANCSTTAQRGALDWKPKFKAATMPVFKDLYTGKNKKLLTAPREGDLAQELREARDRALAHLVAGGDDE